MKKILLTLVLFTTTLLTGIAAESSRTFNLSGFTMISMGSAFKIDVRQGSQFKITATGDAGDLDDLEVKVTGGKLTARFRNSAWKNRHRVSFSIEMPSLTGVDFSGASSATVTGFRGERKMNVDISGASKVTMDFAAEEVLLDLSGASSLTLRGKARTLRGDVSGASSLDGEDFTAEDVEMDASGASSAAVFASASIKADASGASRIRYAGDAKAIRVNTSGASSIKRGN